jgi:pyruvate/oxaloacetate carboxyltransferase
LLLQNGYPPHDERIFESQIPGGMLTNLYNQLREIGNLDILDQVLEEVSRVRARAGYPPLVTPTSQIIGSQATYNVMIGESYSFVSNEFQMLLRGEFGRTPVPPDGDLVAKVLDPNDEILVYRPAAYLIPLLEDDQLPHFVKSQKDRLLHHMLGQPADAFLERRSIQAGERLDNLINDVVIGI